MLRLIAVVLALQAVAGHGNLEVRARNERAIIGGDDATIDNFPYQLSLRIFDQHACGASLIGGSWALTAGHCCGGLEVTAFSLRAGSSRSDIGGVKYLIKRLVQHESFNSVTMDYDICAMETVLPFKTSRLIKAIPLDPVTFTYPPKSYVIITGWGRTENRLGTGASSQLQSAIVSIYDHDKCVAHYKKFGTTSYVTERQVCAGADPSGRDACQGDSGGPMAYNGRLVGVVSWGIGCGDKRFPGIYTSVALMRGWIRNTTGI